ncbi:hypothetical protein D3C81_2292790 [compost metagenome]
MLWNEDGGGFAALQKGILFVHLDQLGLTFQTLPNILAFPPTAERLEMHPDDPGLG